MTAGSRGDVTPELVGRLAQLSGLHLSPERDVALVPFLEGFLAGAARLEEVDVSRCEPPVAFGRPPTRQVGH